MPANTSQGGDLSPGRLERHAETKVWTSLPRQETLRSRQAAMPFLGILFAPGTQPSGSELAAPSFAGHINYAAPSPPPPSPSTT